MAIVKAVSVRISTDGAADAKLKIDSVSARADELGKLDPTIKVQVDTAAASVKLGILRAELRRTAAVAGFQGTPGGGGGGAAKGGFKLGGGFLGAIASGLSSILSLPWQASIPILAGIAAAILVIVSALGSMVSAVAAAGIGLAAFGAFAIPTFMKITGGIQAVSAAADKLNTDKLVKGITSAQLAADRLGQSKAWAAIPVALRPSVQAGLDLKGTFDKLVTAMRPQAVRIFGDALKVIGDILPQLLPIAKTAGKAIDGLLKGFDQFAKSAGFKSFMAQMQQLAGPAITAIGQGLGQVAVALGQFLQTAASPDGIIALKAAFWLLAGAVKLITVGMRVAQTEFKAFLDAGLWWGGVMIGVAKRVADAFLGAVGTIAGIASLIPGPWQKSMQKIAGAVGRAKTSADTFFADAGARLANLKSRIDSTQLVFHLQGNILDLQNKLATARHLLADKNLTATRRARIEANISQAMSQIAAIRVALNALNGSVATTYVKTVPIGGGAYLTHRASGGPASGWTMINESGPEIVDLPPGSYVHNAAASRQMIGQGGDTYNISVYASPLASPSDVGRQVVQALQAYNKSAGPIKLKIRS